MQLQKIETKIFEIRGQKVMLDFDLAELYEVETRTLNQAVKRNIDIFPDDFMFQLTKIELEAILSQIVMTNPENIGNKGMQNLKSQNVISSWGGNRKLPFAFTEHGVTMLANVLKSKKARQTSIAIVRAFIALKQYALTHKELTYKLKEIENKYNKQFKDVYEAINYLLQKDEQKIEQKERKQIGFKRP
ncbi:MAG: ORF6N domain-containing protein [Bacteroidetes bacterium]|nr:ORF6N domain-containing protein [Bacteroidota bacterium]